MIKVAIVYHSVSGHTKLQAKAVRRGVESTGDADILFMNAEEAANRLDELDAMDALIFGCPTYGGNISAGFKLFIEQADGKYLTQAWKDKITGAFTSSASFSGEKTHTMVGLMINAMQHSMIYVSLGAMPAWSVMPSLRTVQGPGSDAINRIDASIGPMATSFEVPAGDAPPKGDLDTAEGYGRRIAVITAQFVRGRVKRP